MGQNWEDFGNMNTKFLKGEHYWGHVRNETPKLKNPHSLKRKKNALWYYWKALNEHKCTKVLS
jgi:hypothetical protein